METTPPGIRYARPAHPPRSARRAIRHHVSQQKAANCCRQNVVGGTMHIVRRLATALVAGTLLTACGGPTVTPTPVPPSPASGDVTTYRGDAARTGVMPGPGPTG